MSRAAAALRSHLISMHGFDWNSTPIRDRDLEEMRRLHREDHEDLSRIDVYFPVEEHPEGSRKTGTRCSIGRANAKEKAEAKCDDCKNPDRCCGIHSKHVNPHRGCILR